MGVQAVEQICLRVGEILGGISKTVEHPLNQGGRPLLRATVPESVSVSVCACALGCVIAISRDIGLHT